MFIRISPDEKKFNIFKEINEIHRHIKKSTKISLVDDLSKRLLELEFKSNHSIKSNCLKWIAKNYYLQYKDLKNVRSKINPIKTEEKSRTTYCIGCKDYTHNFKLKEIKMTNKGLREKSNCVVCWSRISRFLNQKHNNKK